ncbi:chemotaxis response regulator protein-glutamate methylesterase [Solemya pervernicosa gill symbiont]|uniref:Protein-glutamate methylesterase/protein-glutamine glutaminase n=2 Tax=Gammaproteobacteria incertae sedis TaxID=118884 RepID=A0A1T2L5A2_9GAMM|nr:chemotaxis response regulator protein-glutamate methylesterase [Candidatus Reidiella endopervernicosa]OOZ40298.1 chemotaxis response regulator protein-glutamate methylesterase [Solemya pervernicosa gill symbiont]QKQ26959.1 chemotaxis response regulator protein-glutamate methylesterase [Candidatus Reidiella endopervernicosa]
MIKVLIVDDSALIRQVLREILDADPEIEVVGAAVDPYDARDKIKALNPDVLTLDVEMPRMDGITFLKNLMRLRPMPVVMISTLTEQGASVTLQALEFGAVDFISKPKLDVSQSIAEYAEVIVEKVKAAASASMLVLGRASRETKPQGAAGQAQRHIRSLAAGAAYQATHRLIAIGASTGGTEAIKEVLEVMPADAPGTVITQHIPAMFSKSFSERLDSLSAMKVKEAENGDYVLPGHAFVAPGDYHMEVNRDGARYVISLNQSDPVNRHRPAVDVMMNSVARNVGSNAIGVILTGMGADGAAAGMRQMHDAGAPTIAQDEKSCVVWGMPKEAVNKGGVDFVLPLNKVADKLLDLAAEVPKSADRNG